MHFVSLSCKINILISETFPVFSCKFTSILEILTFFINIHTLSQFCKTLSFYLTIALICHCQKQIHHHKPIIFISMGKLEQKDSLCLIGMYMDMNSRSLTVVLQMSILYVVEGP